MARGTFLIRRTTMPGVEAVEAETDHVFPKHTHDQYGIGVVRRGGHRSLSGRGMVEAGPGNVITVNPGEVHDGMPIGGQGRMWTMLYFDPRVIGDAADDVYGAVRSRELHHPVLADGMAAERFLRLHALLSGDDGGLAIETESLLLGLVRRLTSDNAVEPAKSFAQSLRHAQALIDDAPAKELTLGDLACVSDLSRFQVLRGFAKMTGLTPHAYLMQKRADLARQLIRRKMPLAEVAAASGFADQSHMTRTFVSKYGVTPGGYAAAAD